MNEMIDDFKDTWLKVMRSPDDFFAQMPTKGGYADPVRFAAINYLIAGISLMIIQFAFQYMSGGMNIALISLAMGFVSFIGILIIGFIGLFIGGGMLHIFFRVLGGTGTYEGMIYRHYLNPVKKS
ncbi:MAG: YIP1 family protein [ANME-2 cluster archaeon]|nr:YIP1 family protein [ANME-2 cluster archaeon]